LAAKNVRENSAPSHNVIKNY